MWDTGLSLLSTLEFFIFPVLGIFLLFLVIKGIGITNRAKTALDLGQESVDLQKKMIEQLDSLIEEVRKLKK